MAMGRQEALRAIPPVNEIMGCDRIAALMPDRGRDGILFAARKAIEEYRDAIAADDGYCVRNNIVSAEFVSSHLVDKTLEILSLQEMHSLKKVINATGVVLHTNLGRAPLPQSAIEAMAAVSDGYSNLEFDLETGMRGSRQSHLEALICRATGAEGALVVNNNAAAVFLCLNTLAADRGVIISRGQQVEIGGSFRIPDIIKRSGARMTEVGTTNKTRLEDYRSAVTDEVSVLLKVHTSNYKIIGFTETAGLKELVNLAGEMGRGSHDSLIVIEDLGSGSLLDLTAEGIPYEPTVQECIRQGADLVTFSGDKLLGGPQAGIIAGKKVYIDQIRSNPLLRMVRCDKNAIAALKAVFEIYISLGREGIIDTIPVLKMLAADAEELDRKAHLLKQILSEKLNGCCAIEICDEPDEPGGGSFPGTLIPGRAIAITASGRSVPEMMDEMRAADVPVIARINRDRILLSVRTIDEKDFSVVAGVLADILGIGSTAAKEGMLP